MKLYCHIELTDTGFAPNPFWGFLTLAGCKPAIRRTADIGDWSIGLSSSREGHRIIYCMEVDEIMSFGDYYNDERFKKKIPIMDSRKGIYRRGDNIYPKIDGKYSTQLPSRHSNKNRSKNIRHKNRDLGGRHVLISEYFYYFGINMIDNPFKFLTVGRGHTSKFSEDQIEKV
ncbi:unnamed protein product, partial [marine sediment metagenome]